MKRGLLKSTFPIHLKTARRFEKDPKSKGRYKKAPRGVKFLLEPPYGRLPESPSHDFLQKVRVNILFGYAWESEVSIFGQSKMFLARFIEMPRSYVP